MAEIQVTQTGNRRSSDAAFDLNLAPFLDIIVSIIPMLLLSAVFIEIKTIETPVPTVVTEAIENADKKKEVVISLKVSKQKGFEYLIDDKGKQKTIKVALANGTLDYDSLFRTTLQVKESYPDIFRLQLEPEKDVSFDEVVRTMDKVRKQNHGGRKIAFTDTKTGQKIETDLMFPNVTFSNVVGE